VRADGQGLGIEGLFTAAIERPAAVLRADQRAKPQALRAAVRASQFHVGMWSMALNVDSLILVPLWPVAVNGCMSLLIQLRVDALTMRNGIS
jgi:hypothetical protein